MEKRIKFVCDLVEVTKEVRRAIVGEWTSLYAGEAGESERCLRESGHSMADEELRLSCIIANQDASSTKKAPESKWAIGDAMHPCTATKYHTSVKTDCHHVDYFDHAIRTRTGQSKKLLRVFSLPCERCFA
jgi:hypothetical protein